MLTRFRRGFYAMLLAVGASAASHAADDCRYCTTTQIPALTAALAHYKELARAEDWPKWQKGKTLLPDMTDPRVPDLRDLLTREGDLAAGVAPSPSAPSSSQAPLPAAKGAAASGGMPAVDMEAESDVQDRYDPALVQAVKQFQTRHGLTPDGHIGAGTQAALSLRPTDYLRKLDATLARMQAMPFTPEPRAAVINLPAFTLTALNDGKEALIMRVIAGGPKTPTPLFNSTITQVVFNPAWHVPSSIATKELLPKLHDDPDYFADNDFVVTQNGVAVNPHHVNFNAGHILFRQRSGDDNALGKIKFLLPNTDSVYLHATSAPKLFAKDLRGLSHGCVRLEKPREFAHFVLGPDPKWPSARIDQYYDADTTHTYPAPILPVHLVYWTAFAEADGTVRFYPDIYKMDK